MTRCTSAIVAVMTVLAGATPARATHDHPRKASKHLVTFVRAYTQCNLASATTVHNPPLNFAACAAAPASTPLRWGPKGVGQAKYMVKVNAAKQATDIALVYKFVDVVDTATGTGFNGTLTVSAVVRLTDHNCLAPGPCTVIDIPFPVNVPCGSAASPPLAAGKCSLKTATSVTIAGAVVPGMEMNVELAQLQVYTGSDLAFVAGVQLN